MSLNHNLNPRKSSNRGRSNKKKSELIFNQLLENLIFDNIGLSEYADTGITSGFFDDVNESPKEITIDERLYNSYKNKIDENLPF